MSLSTIILFILIFEMALVSQAYAGVQEGVRGASRLWPISIRLSLSSSFGEYRDGHIHAGLDIRTFGQEGVRVRAVGDGAILRMRASPGGYGKVLYQKLNTGETVVYAHLSEFSPALEDYLYRTQLERESYEVDLAPPTDAFHFTEGQIIGFSGSTGASAPHLHFEVRNIRGEPVNPLSRGWKLHDNLCPIIFSLLAVPLGKNSKVNGRGFPLEIRLKKIGNCAFQSEDTLSFQGRIGIGVQIIDRTGKDSGKLAPYEIELTIDDIAIASITAEGFSYGQTREVELQYDMARMRKNGKKFILLFKRKGETILGRSFKNNGTIEQGFLLSRDTVMGKDAVHVVRLNASDRNGNESETQILLTLGNSERKSASGIRYCELPGLFIYDDLINLDLDRLTPEKLPLPDSLLLYGGARSGSAGTNEVSFIAGELDLPSLPLEVDNSGQPLKVFIMPFIRENGVKRFSLDCGVSVIMRPSSFFSDAFVIIIPHPPGDWLDSAGKNAERISEEFFIGPYSLALREGLNLSYALDHLAQGKEGLYRWNGRKKEWKYCISSVERDTVRAMVDEPGVYAVLRDTIPPSMGEPKVLAHSMYGTGKTYPEIVIPLADEGSGIDYSKTFIYLDGEKQIARWDPFSKKMFVLIRDENIIGKHELSITVSDMVDNKFNKSITVQVQNYLFKKTHQGAKRNGR